MEFGENLKRICADRGTTATKVCKELGLSTSKVSAWFMGSLPKQEVLIQLAERLNCSVMDFFADENDIVTPELDEDEQDIVRIFRQLSRKDKHEFMAQLYALEKGLNG